MKNIIKEIQFDNFDSFVKAISYGGEIYNTIYPNFIFRGESSDKFKLIPSALREDNRNKVMRLGNCNGLENQMMRIAEKVREAGAVILRGGAFKPRTSPYSFQGLGSEGLKMLVEAKKATGLPIVTEIMSAEHLPLFEEQPIFHFAASFPFYATPIPSAILHSLASAH